MLRNALSLEVDGGRGGADVMYSLHVGRRASSAGQEVATHMTVSACGPFPSVQQGANQSSTHLHTQAVKSLRPASTSQRSLPCNKTWLRECRIRKYTAKYDT